MAKQTIDIGSSADDRTGDTGRAAFDKCNDNFDELYGYQDIVAIGATSGATPTQEELISALGDPSTNGSGWHKFIYSVNGGTTYYFLAYAYGNKYYLSEYTVAP